MTATGVRSDKHIRASTKWTDSIKDGDIPRDDEDDRLVHLLRRCGEVGTESSREVVIGSNNDEVDPN